MALEIKTNSDSDQKKSKKPSHTRVHFILDESGSMGSCRQSTIDGFNEYLQGLRVDNQKTGNKYKISLTKFEGGNIESVFSDLKIEEVRDITYNDFTPAGMTNLNDAIGSTLSKMKSKRVNKNTKTLVIIMTDGHENASREYSVGDVRLLVEEVESKGWTVTFLGANIDTQTVGRAYSIDQSRMKSYSTQNMRGTMAALSEATVAYACSAPVGKASRSFFADVGDLESISVPDSTVSASTVSKSTVASSEAKLRELNFVLGINKGDENDA